MGNSEIQVETNPRIKAIISEMKKLRIVNIDSGVSYSGEKITPKIKDLTLEMKRLGVETLGYAMDYPVIDVKREDLEKITTLVAYCNRNTSGDGVDTVKWCVYPIYELMVVPSFGIDAITIDDVIKSIEQFIRKLKELKVIPKF